MELKTEPKPQLPSWVESTSKVTIAEDDEIEIGFEYAFTAKSNLIECMLLNQVCSRKIHGWKAVALCVTCQH